MKNYKKENYELLRDLTILIGVLVIVIGAISWGYFKDGYFREWISLIISLLGSLIGAVIAMAGVILTLNRSIDSEEKQKLERIKKLKIILRFEIEKFISSFEKEILRYIYERKSIVDSDIEQVHSKYEFETRKGEIKYKNIYKISSQFKEYIYELMLLDNNFKTNELMDFYEVYSILEEKLPDINLDVKEIEEGINTFLSSKYSDIMDYVHYRFFDNEEFKVVGLNLIENKKDKIGKELSELYKEVDKGNIHKSNLTNKVLEYLKEN
ncbi:hypothetical protein [Clostridium perfringens]|uniref:hypothetical protein n=1 Tax=Clostridium perfringens TaxID=1502 RepID=UPI0039E8E5D7